MVILATLGGPVRPALATEPAPVVESPSEETPSAFTPTTSFSPYDVGPGQLELPAMDLPPLPAVPDPFADAPPLEGQANASSPDAIPAVGMTGPSADDLRDPFAENASDQAWAANLQPHRFDALLELLDPFREKDSSRSSYRAIALTQRASDGLRDPFSMDARAARRFTEWTTDLRNPFDPEARPVRATPGACGLRGDGARTGQCATDLESLRDPFNSR